MSRLSAAGADRIHLPARCVGAGHSGCSPNACALRILRRSFYEAELLPLCWGLGGERGLADSNLDHCEERGRSAADEVGCLGLAAGRRSFHVALRRWLICWAHRPIRWLTDTAVLPLVLIPLAFGYSVVRYRLMDVELVVRRVFVYALTTLAIALMIGRGGLPRRPLRVRWRSGV